ncbi:MAG: VanZ family protein [Planctomycetes bacterium]|nr:VanZ family protein [Planctomycetota bacterium]
MLSLSRLRRWPAIIATIATAAVVAMLLSPSSYVTSEHLLPHADKIAHAVVFAALAIVWRWSEASWHTILPGAIALAGITEVLQAYLPIHRDGEFLDAAADLAGACAGLLIWRFIRPGRGGGPGQER